MAHKRASAEGTSAVEKPVESNQARKWREHKERTDMGATALGMNDKDVTPGEGEVTWEQYQKAREKVYQENYGDAENRIIRDGNVYRYANGKFATKEAYDAQLLGSRVVAEESGPENPEASEYEDLNFTELIQKAATAQQDNDKDKLSEIRLAAERYLSSDTSDEYDTPEESQVKLDEALERFDHSVEGLIKIRRIRAENEKTKPADRIRTEYNGEEVTILGVGEVDGEKIVKIRQSDGSEEYVKKSDILTIVPRPESEAHDAPKKPEKKKIEVVEAAVADGTESTAETTSEQETKLSPASLENIKQWFAKEARHYQEFGGRAYFAAKWERAKLGGAAAVSGVLNIGVTQDMIDNQPEEAEKKRRRNRRIAIAGLSALAATALFVGGYKLGHAAGSNGAHLADALPDDAGLPTPELTPSPNASPQASDTMKDILDHGGDVQSAPSVPEVGSYPLEAFKIEPGQGGRELLENLKINPAEWPNIKQELLEKFPQDFMSVGKYSDGSDNVQISHSGWLSTATQNYLRALAQK